jgi:WD40 repeat protein
VISNDRLACGSSENRIEIWTLNKNAYKNVLKLVGHTSFVKCIKSLSENRLASGSVDKTIRIWDLSGDGKCLFVLKGHKEMINCLKILPNNRGLISSATEVKVWSLTRGKCMQTLGATSQYWIQCLCILMQDSQVACGSPDDGIVRIWKYLDNLD